jgi:hypothetical protein
MDFWNKISMDLHVGACTRALLCIQYLRCLEAGSMSMLLASCMLQRSLSWTILIRSVYCLLCYVNRSMSNSLLCTIHCKLVKLKLVYYIRAYILSWGPPGPFVQIYLNQYICRSGTSGAWLRPRQRPSRMQMAAPIGLVCRNSFEGWLFLFLDAYLLCSLQICRLLYKAEAEASLYTSISLSKNDTIL